VRTPWVEVEDMRVKTDRTRLKALENVLALIAEDMAYELSKMVENGWTLDDAAHAALVWWESNVQQAMQEALGHCSPADADSDA
jgi:hypothetical protein